jgi:hypothetical protein
MKHCQAFEQLRLSTDLNQQLLLCPSARSPALQCCLVAMPWEVGSFCLNAFKQPLLQHIVDSALVAGL